MSGSARRRVVAALVVLLALVLPAQRAKADSIGNAVVAATIGIVVVTAAITTAVVLTVKHHPSVTGCASQGANGLEMVNEGDQTSYLLAGDTVGIKPGDRMKLSGKKNGKDAVGSRHFFVEKIKKDYGACKVAHT